MDETNTFENRKAHINMLSNAENAEIDSINFSELYRKNVTNIFYYLYSRVRNVADAEDLTSETFTTALEKYCTLRDPAKFTPWVFTIARNKAMDYFRKSKQRPVTDYDEGMVDASHGDVRQSRTDCDRLLDLERIISRLNPREQEYLRLRVVADLPFAEIGEILSMPETRIKKKYYRLLERLQAQVEE